MQTSSMLVGTEEAPVEFEWTCEKGLQGSTRKVLEEFTKVHSKTMNFAFLYLFYYLPSRCCH